MDPCQCGCCNYIYYLRDSTKHINDIVVKYYKEYTHSNEVVDINDIIEFDEEAHDGIYAYGIRKRFHDELLKCRDLYADVYDISEDMLFDYYPYETDMRCIPNVEIYYSETIRLYDDEDIHVITDRDYFKYVKHNMEIHKHKTMSSDELLARVQTPELKLKILLHDTCKITRHEDYYMVYSTVVYKNRIYTYVC